MHLSRVPPRVNCWCFSGFPVRKMANTERSFSPLVYVFRGFSFYVDGLRLPSISGFDYASQWNLFPSRFKFFTMNELCVGDWSERWRTTFPLNWTFRFIVHRGKITGSCFFLLLRLNLRACPDTSTKYLCSLHIILFGRRRTFELVLNNLNSFQFHQHGGTFSQSGDF